MQASSIPAKYPIPFAENAGGGYIRSIPENPTSTPGQASLSLGFPPLTFEPVGSGGIPPFGQDMNGIMNQETAWSQWVQAGGPFVYDGTFSTAIGGYPNGAILAMADGTGFWRSTVDNNTSNPDTGGANWISAGSYGVVSIALSSSNVTLTAPQWCKSLITISGTLSANVQVIFPTGFSGQWLIQNNCTGSFTVTAKTSSGTGVSIPQGGATAVWGDGVNIYPSSFSVTSVEPANTVYAGPTSGAAALPTFRKLTLADIPAIPGGIPGTRSADFAGANSSGSPNSSATVTASYLVLGNGSGSTVTVNNANLSASLTTHGAGGLDTGSVSANTGYYFYAISTGSVATGLWSLNATTPLLPGGYSYYAPVYWGSTDGSGNLYRLAKRNYRSWYTVTPTTNTASLPVAISGIAGNGSTPTWASVSLQNLTSPRALSATFMLSIKDPGGGSAVAIAPSQNYSIIDIPNPNPPNIPVEIAINSAQYDISLLQRLNIEVPGTIYYISGLSGAIVQVYEWDDPF